MVPFPPTLAKYHITEEQQAEMTSNIEGVSFNDYLKTSGNYSKTQGPASVLWKPVEILIISSKMENVWESFHNCACIIA